MTSKMTMSDFIDITANKQTWEIERVAADIIDSLDLSHTGKKLDRIGKLIGCQRFGLSDSLYLRKIKAFALLQNSSGKYHEIVQLIKYVTDATDVTIEYLGNATIKISANIVWTTWAVDNLRTFVESALAAGVCLTDIIHSGTVGSFSFSEFGNSGVTPIGLGFGDLTDPTIGGKFNYIIL